MFKRKIGRPSNSEIKKRRIIKALALSIVFIAILSLTYTLTNINTRRLKGDSGPDYYGISCEEETACYQAGFRNGNLYQAVIDRYNSENSASLTYEDVITDEQLLSITSLDARKGNIDDATGIEKLVNLKDLYLPDNNLNSIDLSNNTKLNGLDLGNNNLTSIDLSNLTNLENMDLGGNNLTSIDLSNLINLVDLKLDNNRISTLDLSNLTNLDELDICSTSITELNLPNYLASLDIDYLSYINNDININRIGEIHINPIILQKNETFDIYNELGISSDMISNMSIYDDGENVLSINNNVFSANNIGISEIELDLSETNINLYFVVSDAIESNKYNINYEERYLYTGLDNNEVIVNNLYYEHELLDMLGIDGYNIDIDNSKLNISVPDPETDLEYILRPYNLGRIDLSSYEINEKEITVNGVFNYEEVPHDNVELEYSNNTLIVKDLNGNEVDRYTVVGNNDPGIIDPEPINPENNNGNPAPNNNDENNNVDNNTNNNQSNNNNNNQNTNDNNKIEESTANNAVIEKEDITSKKTTLNKFEKNAKTYDDIVKYFIIGGIAIVIIVGMVIYTKKRK